MSAKIEYECVEQWALHFISTTSLEGKTNPGPAPSQFLGEAVELPTKPGRPAELTVSEEKPRAFKPGSLVRPSARAELNHKFWHHELQAAELFCWAILRFPETELDFRRGLLRLAQDEIRHMALYQERIQSNGFSLGSFKIRDWFWDRVPSCTSPLQFVALMGMGLEAANLEHTTRFSCWFREVGDEASALVQDQVGLEEIAHVRFATHWFATWTGGVNFEEWKSSLPPPLSPLLMKGKSIDRQRRLDAHFPSQFIDDLSEWCPDDS